MQENNDTKLNRRKFVTSLGLLSAVAGLNPLKAFSKTPLLPEATETMKCRPYLQAAEKNQITVRWITAAPSHSWVEYGEARENLNQKAQQVEEGMIQVDNRIHAVTLKNLEPGKTYYYRAVSRKTENLERKRQAFGKAESSNIYSFTTPSENTNTVEFLVFNDIHDRPESFGTLMQYAGPGKKDFVFLNGDMFNKSEDENQIISHLIDPLTASFASSTPFIFARGNHETWGGFARQLGDYFDGKENKYYYSFQQGPMYGIVMDSGETKSDKDPVNGGIVDFDAYRERQREWLAKEVQKKEFKKAKYKIVFIHIPPYYIDEDAHAANHHKELWGPIFDSAKIDLMFCGHTHKHGVHLPVAGKHSYPIVIGGGPTEGKRTIINVKVSDKALNLQMKDDQGKVVGSLNL